MAPEESSNFSSTVKRKILLLYPYYWPHYKAGGPVQSIFNIVSSFQHVFDFFLVSLDQDIDGHYPEKPLATNNWTKGPNGENIYFLTSISPFILFRLMRKVKPDVVFINGMFNINTTISGILLAKCFRTKVIISPRGMLQAWGLERNRFVKKVFLTVLRAFLKKDETWHASDDQERKDIIKNFGTRQVVHLASNIPRKLGEGKDIRFPTEEGKIRLVFLSLINSNKNLHLIIRAVNKSPDKFLLDIYGPVIDKGYWDLCNQEIQDNPSIRYKGPVPPWDVPDLLSLYHYFVLPTQGENFGHAIFDSLSSSVPVIISKNTPWQGLDIHRAGFYIDISDENSLMDILGEISNQAREEYSEYRKNSFQFAKDYWAGKQISKDYHFLNGD